MWRPSLYLRLGPPDPLRDHLHTLRINRLLRIDAWSKPIYIVGDERKIVRRAGPPSPAEQGGTAHAGISVLLDPIPQQHKDTLNPLHVYAKRF